ncbi:antitoxin HicB [Candidatus Magnetomoraceae bacterium gMMP-15]
MINYTAKYTKINSGYMGQLIEWPEVITEGKNLDECRLMLKDALHEMILAYYELGKPIPSIPLCNDIIEHLSIEEEHVCQAT